MLKIGVLGAGHLGKIHLNCIKQIEKYDLVGFYDPAMETARQVEAEMKVKCFDSIDALIDAVDVVDIVTPTIRHFECASKALQKRKHVFIEKPVSTRLLSRLNLSSKTRSSSRHIVWHSSTRAVPTCLLCST